MISSYKSKDNHDDPIYDAFLAKINERFQAISGPLFTTNATGLFEAYLNGFTDDQRQHHNCHACRHFIKRFGGLVTIDETGNTTPAIWNQKDAPSFYHQAIAAMESIVSRAKVTGVFLSSDNVWGQPKTGIWRHFYVVNKSNFWNPTQTAGQAMAEKREDFKNVIQALSDFTMPMLERTLKLLKSETLYRSEKIIGPAQWLYDLHIARNAVKHPYRSNIVWKAIATAPAGFCHPRSSMIGTLLEDIAAGMDFPQISRRFAKKMHPLRYQRPQVAPSAGNIAQAEKIVAQLNAASSLERRFARLDEIETIWKPSPSQKKEQSTEGIFGHLQSKEASKIKEIASIPTIKMTWVKFARTILPVAKKIEVFVPRHGDFIALVTATNENAPPILQWDLPERRNPVSWYRYHRGSNANQWGLSGNSWCPVTAACLYPGRWFGGICNHGNEAMFILEGAVDARPDSLGLFPEILKSEFHQIRATIEAYSQSKKISGQKEASACGICAVGSYVRVEKLEEYVIDQWE